MDDCNVCTCDSSGTQARCTTKPCDPVQRNKRSSTCNPGDCFCYKDEKKNWNQCCCTRNKFLACSPAMEKVCYAKFPIRNSISDESQPVARPNVRPPPIRRPTTAAPPSSEDLQIVTEEELSSPSFRCQPGKAFKLDCNTCWCSRNGRSAKSCTRIACHPKVYPPLSDQ